MIHGCEQGNAQRIKMNEHVSVIIGTGYYQVCNETTFRKRMPTG
jgi:hypothetical protein